MIGKYHGKDKGRIRVQESNTESSLGKNNEAEGRNKGNAKPGLTKIRMEPIYGEVDVHFSSTHLSGAHCSGVHFFQENCL